VPVLQTLNFISTAVNDGAVLETSETSGLGGNLDVAARTFNLGDDKSNKQYVAILSFDTSSLPDTAVITSVTLKINKQGVSGTDPFTTHGNLVADIQSPYFGATAGLTADDFQAPADTLVVGTFDITPVSNWYSAVVNELSNINLIDTTQFRLRFSLDDDNDRRADYAKFYSGEAQSSADRPQLIVTYYIP